MWSEERAHWRWRAAGRVGHANAVQPQPQRARGRLCPVEHQHEARRDGAAVGRAARTVHVGGRRAAAATASAGADARHTEERLRRRCRPRSTEWCRRRGTEQAETRIGGGEVEVERGAARGRMLLDEAAQLGPCLACLTQHRRRLPRRTRLVSWLGRIDGLLQSVAHPAWNRNPNRNPNPNPKLQTPSPAPAPAATLSLARTCQCSLPRWHTARAAWCGSRESSADARA